MRMRVSLAVAAAILTLAVRIGSGSFVSIADLSDGAPVVSTDVPFAVVIIRPEFADVAGVLTDPAEFITPAPGTTAVALMEPSSDPFDQPVSDTVILSVDKPRQSAVTGQIVETQRFEIVLTSDAAGSVPLPTNFKTLAEDGTLQDVTALLTSSSGLKISVQSDVGGPETPLPASVWGGSMLLTGLAVWPVIRKRAGAGAVEIEHSNML